MISVAAKSLSINNFNINIQQKLYFITQIKDSVKVFFWCSKVEFIYTTIITQPGLIANKSNP